MQVVAHAQKATLNRAIDMAETVIAETALEKQSNSYSVIKMDVEPTALYNIAEGIKKWVMPWVDLNSLL